MANGSTGHIVNLYKKDQKLNSIELIELEKEASKAGLLLRVQVNRPLNLWTIRVVVAVPSGSERVSFLGEMKAWAYAGEGGFQLDTMTVSSKSPVGIGHLIWAATMKPRNLINKSQTINEYLIGKEIKNLLRWSQNPESGELSWARAA